MYPHYAHPAMDPSTSILPAGGLHHQPPLPTVSRPQYVLQPPPFQHSAQPIHYPPQPMAPPEPLPSATDVPQTLGLPLHQMAEFASSMVYLMWHARRPSVMALHSASVSSALSPSGAGAEKEEMCSDDNGSTEQDDIQHRETASIANATSSAFKKFSRQILHATQLSESVVMLSLKYIAMLLQKSPNIQGAEGSEYRLFTVALMLANKFLDDNTFTNKAWSDVSGMRAADLNIMELEFLDVLDFRLFVDKDEFGRWKIALVHFKDQLHSVYQAQEQEQRQKMIEASLRSVGVSMLQPQDQHPWAMQQQDAGRQQQQYHPQYFYLLSKAQQPHFPTQPINQPLMRVPLRIPAQPVYMNSGHSVSHGGGGQQAAPPPPPQFPHHCQQQQLSVYDDMMRSSAAAMATGPISADSKRPFVAPSPIDTPYSSYPSYPPPRPPSRMQQAPAARLTPSQPMAHHSSAYDANAAAAPYRATGDIDQNAMYSYRTPLQPASSSGGFVPPVSAAAIGGHPHPAARPQPPPDEDHKSSSSMSFQTVPHAMYYYATPAATPASGIADNAYGRPVRPYYADPSAQPYPASSTPSSALANAGNQNGNPTHTQNTHTMHNNQPTHNRPPSTSTIRPM